MATQAGRNLQELIATALAPYPERPPAEGVALLIDDLITCGQRLHDAAVRIPQNQRAPKITSAVDEWEYVSAVGPRSSEPNANWNHARGLARIARALISALSEYESSAVQ
ncbi:MULTISPECIES: DUF6415 family natural product biosynthesis protein [unclassified Streptomyces]|uniref:DUF6415 family natural product biosynthesis protein n=1 Tax=Streptomyces TaxID=1883 RepID=UPI000DC7D5A1|nr:MULTISPECIES: DUF6415 family natural product biosynthesis protein [unclassified Streptomyces]AWZ09690.1 hypothetical protein DRB89_40625 [Streptomyces sp. ICC4]AWZ17058.1 hypothetical protein DRB96_38390 [Streptomyces sp. ICC1]